MKIAFCLSSRLANSGSAASETLRFVAHLLNDIVRWIALCTCNSQVETISTVMAEVMHCAVEPGPMLFLLGREFQFGLDPIDIGIAVRHDLFGVQLRRTVLGKHRLLASLAGFGRFGALR